MAIVEEQSTITAKGQITLPRAVRRALGVAAGDKVRFSVVDGAVTVTAANDDDPAIGAFLSFLASDMTRRPDLLASMPQPLIDDISALTDNMDASHDEPIIGDVAL